MASKKHAAVRVQDFPAHAEVGIDAQRKGIVGGEMPWALILSSPP